MKHAKALTAAVVTALGALGTALAQGNGHVSYQAVISIVISFAYALAVILGVPNISVGTGLVVTPAWQAYAKAIYAAFLAGLGAFATAYTQGHGVIGWPAVIGIALTFFTALGAVWRVPNTPGPAPEPAAGMSKPHRGY